MLGVGGTIASVNDEDTKLLSAFDWLRGAEIVDDAAWVALATRCVELLGGALGRQLALDPRHVPFISPVKVRTADGALATGDCVSVWAIEPRTPGPAEVTVRANVAASLEAQVLAIDAIIFYYVGGIRVGPRIERGLAPYRSSPFDYGEFLHARMVASSDGQPRWEIGEWDQGFTEDEWAKLERW
jgi:hypothetical protein